jgi:hypothetical protein
MKKLKSRIVKQPLLIIWGIEKIAFEELVLERHQVFAGIKHLGFQDRVMVQVIDRLISHIDSVIGAKILISIGDRNVGIIETSSGLIQLAIHVIHFTDHLMSIVFHVGDETT